MGQKTLAKKTNAEHRKEEIVRTVELIKDNLHSAKHNLEWIEDLVTYKRDFGKLQKTSEKTKPKVIILDNNPMSVAGYAEEFPENWKKICEALEKKEAKC